MIREKLRKEITETINQNPKFDLLDFNINTTSIPQGVRLKIQFLPSPKYYITFNIPSAVRYSSYSKTASNISHDIPCEVCPGELSPVERFSFEDKDFIKTIIANWMNCMWDEFLSDPFVRNMNNEQERMKAQINDFMEKYNRFTEGEFFTNDESLEMRDRLDEMEIALKEQISKFNESNVNLEKELANLHRDISTLKQTIQSFDKKGWMKSFASKAARWSIKSENVNLITAITSFGKTLLE